MPVVTLPSVATQLLALSQLLQAPLSQVLKEYPPDLSAGDIILSDFTPHLDTPLHEFMQWLTTDDNDVLGGLLELPFHGINPFKVLWDLYFPG